MVALHKLTLQKQPSAINEYDITENLTYCDGNESDDDIGTHESQGNGDGTA